MIENGVVAVKTPRDLVSLREKGRSAQHFVPDGLLEVWDGEQWTPDSLGPRLARVAVAALPAD